MTSFPTSSAPAQNEISAAINRANATAPFCPAVSGIGTNGTASIENQNTPERSTSASAILTSDVRFKPTQTHRQFMNPAKTGAK